MFKSILQDKISAILLLLIVLSVGARFINVDSTVTGRHSWRQADTAAIAKNFAQEEYNILHPRIDWRGSGPGYVETEFQIYPFVVATFYKVFGVNEFIARIVSILFFTGAMFYMFLLIKNIGGVKTALWSVFFFSWIPPSLFYSRTIMPEAALMFMIAAGVYFFYLYVEHNKNRHLAAAAFFVTLACLIKIPTLYIGLPLLMIVYLKKGVRLFGDWKLWLFFAVIVLFNFGWYSYSHRLFVEYGNTFGIWASDDKWGDWELVFSWEYWKVIIFTRLSDLYLRYTGMIFFVIGLFIRTKEKKEKIFYSWIIAGVVYLIVVSKGNYVHEYYQLPIIIPICFFMGKFLSGVSKEFNKVTAKSVLLTLGLIVFFSAGLYKYLTMLDQGNNTHMIKTAEFVSKHTKKEDLGIFFSDGNPAILYLSERKGWIMRENQAHKDYVKEKVKEGAAFLAAPLSVVLPKLQEEYKNAAFYYLDDYCIIIFKEAENI